MIPTRIQPSKNIEKTRLFISLKGMSFPSTKILNDPRI
ncbi:hypothetical protein B712_0764 [Chlamydia psittaci NJ1]|nr:hypothetical protein B712_0764 [Chlamydia psittaci NJ1]